MEVSRASSLWYLELRILERGLRCCRTCITGLWLHLKSTFLQRSFLSGTSLRGLCYSEGESLNFCRATLHYNNCRTEEAAKYLEQTKLQTSNGFTEEFSVMEDLMGLAIGWFLWTSIPVFIHPLALRCPWCEYSASEEDRRHHQRRADRGFLHLQGGLQQNLHQVLSLNEGGGRDEGGSGQGQANVGV